MIVTAVYVYPGKDYPSPDWAAIPAPKVPASAVGRPHWNKRKRELYVILRASTIEDAVDKALEMWEEFDQCRKTSRK